MTFNLSPEQKSEVIHSLQRYLSEEFEYDLRAMPAGFLLEFILKEIGPLAYNQGVEDAQKYFISKTEDLTGVCFEESFTYWDGASRGSRTVARKPS